MIARLEALRTVSRHLRAAGNREFAKLFATLVDPPFGIPNGIIPILAALAFRTDGTRIAMYKGSQNQRVTDAQVAAALVDMAKHPGNYRTRYTKLTGKQRTVFKVGRPPGRASNSANGWPRETRFTGTVRKSGRSSRTGSPHWPRRH